MQTYNPSTPEAEAGGSFMDSLGYMERPCLKKSKTKSKDESIWKGEDIRWGRGDADEAIRPESHVHTGLRTDTVSFGRPPVSVGTAYAHCEQSQNLQPIFTKV